MLSSVLRGGPNLLKSFFLGFILLLTYGVFCFVFFEDNCGYDEQVEGGDPTTAYQCVLKMAFWGFADSLVEPFGGGDPVAFDLPRTVGEDTPDMKRSIFITSFVLTWVVILQG